LGKKDTYEVDISPQYGAEDDIQPMKAAFPTMKGALQFVHDKIGDKEFSPERVGEPKGQGELPLENKMKGVDVSVNNLSKMIFALMGGRNYEGGYEKWLQENIQ
jgi:hypothetical protein